MAHTGKVGCGFFFFFLPYRTACGILVPSPGIEPVPPVLKARNLNLWTAREVQVESVLSWECFELSMRLLHQSAPPPKKNTPERKC